MSTSAGCRRAAPAPAEGYLVRARRVEALAGDRLGSARGADRMQVEVYGVDGGEVRIRYELPPEKVAEAAAARIRPILLEQEDCFYMKALAALGPFYRGSSWDAAWIRAARAEWRHGWIRRGVTGPGYRVVVALQAAMPVCRPGLRLRQVPSPAVEARRQADGPPTWRRPRLRARHSGLGDGTRLRLVAPVQSPPDPLRTTRDLHQGLLELACSLICLRRPAHFMVKRAVS